MNRRPGDSVFSLSCIPASPSVDALDAARVGDSGPRFSLRGVGHAASSPTLSVAILDSKATGPLASKGSTGGGVYRSILLGKYSSSERRRVLRASIRSVRYRHSVRAHVSC